MAVKRVFLKKLRYGLVFVCAVATLTGCPDPNNGSEQNKKSSISGKVSFANPTSSGAITLYLEKTDGFHTGTAVQNNKTVRKIGGANAQKTKAESSGSYRFEDIQEGNYTIYAASEDEQEQAVLINIPVEKDTEVTVEPMILKPVGSIKGKIVLDDSANGNLGFTVFIVGTSYMAVTNQSGNFEIANVPAGQGYEIAVMKGNYATIWTAVSVESETATELEPFNVTSADILGDVMVWKGVLNSPPANPQKNWAYFNVTDKITYIYDGAKWQMMAQVISTNTVVYSGNGNTGGTAPVDPGKYVYGIHVEIKDKGTLEKTGYRFTGWSLEADGGPLYQAGNTIIIRDSQIILYAVWAKLYMLTFDGNGNTGGTAANSLQGITGEFVWVGNVGNLQKNGYNLVGWNTQSDATGTAFSEWGITIGSEDIVLYAIWSEFSFSNGFITGYSGSGKDIIIPAAINTQAVTGIISGAFRSKSLTSVVIPDSVTTIGGSAFEENRLTYIVIPNSVTSIGNSAFSSNRLTAVVIPDSVTSIGEGAFAGNNLTSVVIPDSVTSIGDSAFSSNRLTTVVIPNSVTSIGNSAFQLNRLTSVVIPNSVTSIGYSAFEGNNLTSVVISNSVTSIDAFAFRYNSLTSVVIPNSVTSIGSLAFSSNSLTSVVIPNSVTSIGDSAFYGNSLTSVVIPDSVTTIGRYSFGSTNLTDLTSIVMPANVNIYDNSMGTYGESFFDFYEGNGRKAGTYTCSGGWSAVFR